MASEVASLMAPIVKLGENAGYEVVKNYDLGAGPIDIAWIFKPGPPEVSSLPDVRIGFVNLGAYSESAINSALARSMFNLMDKLIIVVPSEEIAAKVSHSVHRDLKSQSGLLQLRKYVTVLTPSTLVEKAGFVSTRRPSSKDSDPEETSLSEEVV
jgi:hypothetical protein